MIFGIIALVRDKLTWACGKVAEGSGARVAGLVRRPTVGIKPDPLPVVPPPILDPPVIEPPPPVIDPPVVPSPPPRLLGTPHAS